ncbi:uncharacterized protein LOC128282009 [Gossypium arboreum]|uniref:uncharacterized protein LOC128282009 n=1 Tax=Gossypium arboreum TaxID=29729 RepID=UPI0022F186EC|nr:uncharacterized protein LOC128282009 [Gossypium arboreum]
MAPKALYGHRCRTPLCWTELGEHHVLGPELVSDTVDKVRLIRDQLKEVSDKQKSYTDLKHREIEYSVRDFVFLKTSGASCQPVRASSIIGADSQCFHVSMLRSDNSDPMYVISIEEIEVRPNLTFKEESVQILDHDVEILRRKSIPLVKVLWRNHSSEEAT